MRDGAAGGTGALPDHRHRYVSVRLVPDLLAGEVELASERCVYVCSFVAGVKL